MMDTSRSKIDSKTLREKIYDQLRQEIVFGDYLPGQTVTLRNLAERYGVSIIPVREALWQLESERVVVIERNKMVRVNMLTAKDLNEVLAIRLFLESRLASKACEKREESILPILSSLVTEMNTHAGDSRTFLSKNSEFHFAIYRAADMPIHFQIINNLWARMGPYLSLQAKEITAVTQSRLHHRHMVDALASKDVRGLVAALRHDLEDAAHFIMPLLGPG